eukprot:m.47784 g.47784  ORF g.47784 m.47784 type:complete len:158 (+) comp11945_c0_seq2:2373-2846(+)
MLLCCCCCCWRLPNPFQPKSPKAVATWAARSPGTPTAHQPVGRKLTQGQFVKLDHPAIHHHDFHDDEDWMMDSKTQRLLLLPQELRGDIPALRQQAQAKVMRLRFQAENFPHEMTFQDRTAYFATSKASIHPEIAQRVLEEETRKLNQRLAGNDGDH